MNNNKTILKKNSKAILHFTLIRTRDKSIVLKKCQETRSAIHCLPDE